MNLRKDHYRVRVLVARPPTLCLITMLLWRARLYGLPGVSGLPVCARQWPQVEIPVVTVPFLANNNSYKTFNNGSLGSGIDEERSEMR